MLWPILLGLSIASAAEFPPGQIIDDVATADDSGQHYALYVPSTYSTEHAWPVIFAFDPGGRGRTPVERYQAAAERYGYILAGSNNSRNGSWAASINAAQEMIRDVAERFSLDSTRVYTAGMSGGARTAMGFALATGRIAGVFASSAGYPDNKTRKNLAFPVFGTAGTEDFNYLEMRHLERDLTSPHHIAIFEGSHVWLSSDLAVEAVEWMEIQAMKSGLKARDPVEIERIYAQRWAAAAAMPPGPDLAAMESLAADFEGLRDVAECKARVGALRRDKHVLDAIKMDRAEQDREERETNAILAAESRLASSADHQSALAELRETWKKLAASGGQASASVDRRIARRMLRGLTQGVSERVNDPEYRALVATYRSTRPSAAR